jgi:DNA end-binding protein Ku
MAARAIWKGVLKFGAATVPVKLYSAVQDRNIHFNLLHDQDKMRLQQRMVNPATNRVVPTEQIRKGFEADPGLFVLLDENELEELVPESSRDIEITQFLPTGAIDNQWYDRPYYLGPDEDGEGPYFALAEGLARLKREGLARWVMRKRSYVGALRAEDGYLVLNTLRHADEVVPASELEAPQGRALDKKEQAMAEQLVSVFAGRFDPAQYHDEYRERVTELVERKARGEHVQLKRPKAPKPETRGLTDLLAASLKGAQKEKAHDR